MVYLKPGEQASEDSLEYVEGDTESFIDLEDEDLEPPKHPKRVSIQVKVSTHMAFFTNYMEYVEGAQSPSLTWWMRT